MIIDFHTHTFPDKISDRVVEKLGHKIAHIKPFTNGSESALLSTMREGNVDYSVTLPVMTDASQVEKIHNGIFQNMEKNFNQGLISFGGMHPDYTNYKEELRRLKENGVKGIKLHPAYQNINLNDIRMKRIIDAASELGLIVLTHAGIDVGIYDHNYASVANILEIIEEIHPPKFVLAHMGNWGVWDEVESDLAGAPVWFDIAFSIGDLTPFPGDPVKPYMNTNLSEEDFTRLCKKHGINHILFATDSPWADAKDYIKQINTMNFTEEEKKGILGENAVKLLNLPIK